MKISKSKPSQAILIPGSVANLIVRLVEDKDHYINKMSERSHKNHTIINSLEEGMIGIDPKGIVNFMNKSAGKMIGMSVSLHSENIFTKLFLIVSFPKFLLLEELSKIAN